MSVLKQLPAAIDKPSANPESDYHYMCCDNEDLGICGKDLSDYPYDEMTTDDEMCRTCDRLNRDDVSFQEGGPCSLCPLDVFEQLGGSL